MRAAPLLVIPLVMSIVLAPAAQAACAAPSPAIFPLGDAVEPRPVLYRFAPRYSANHPIRIVDAAGQPVAFTEHDESVPGAEVRVSRLVVHGARDSFTVHDGESAAPRTFHVRAQASEAPRELAIGEARWLDDAWTCSHTEGWAFSMHGAGVAAVRARWSDGFEARVPPSDRAFFHQGAMGGEIDPQELHVLLGHPSCVGNLIPAEYIGRLDVQLTVIYSDGHEQGISPRRERAEPKPTQTRRPTREEALEKLRERTCGLVDPFRTPSPVPAPRPWWIAGAAAVGALVTVALVLLVRRRRVTAVP